MAAQCSPAAKAAGAIPIVVIVEQLSRSGGEPERRRVEEALARRTTAAGIAGKAVAPVVQPAGAPERAAFLKIVCGMSDADEANIFCRRRFTGKSAAHCPGSGQRRAQCALS